MLRKYRLESRQNKEKYVEQATLLEPNNVIPSWEIGDEEKKEVSETLRKLRLKYDNIHKTLIAREKELETLKSNLDQANRDEFDIDMRTTKQTFGIDTKQGELETIQNEHKFELMYQRSYYHMLQRMKKDAIAYQIRSSELHDSSRQKSQISMEEAKKSRISKEQRLQAKHKLEEIMRAIDLDQKERHDRIASLQKSIKNKEEALRRRVERVRRQQDIAEQAANENKDSNELKMQEQFVVQKLWSSFLKKKMDVEMLRTQELEDAFQKIKAATGQCDVQQIVHRFLTREQTYSQLLMAVSENERKIDNLRKDNEMWREKLQDLQMNSKQEQKTQNPELTELSKTLEVLTKEKDKSEELNKKVQLVYDQVQGWCMRVIQKIDQQFNENIQAFSDKTTAFLFEKIAQAVCKQLEQIMMEEDEDERGAYITAKDFMNDFATEEFLNKNIRVRPVSGITRGDFEETRTAVDVNFQNRGFGVDNNDDEKESNNMINIDMDEQRRNIKIQKQEYERKKQLEEEKKNKKQRS